MAPIIPIPIFARLLSPTKSILSHSHSMQKINVFSAQK
ncbi:hypothetical protein QH294_1920 [Enterococcus faecalis]|nr:hypothetical protein QH294_1920 [Enterococcus faecalis]